MHLILPITTHYAQSAFRHSYDKSNKRLNEMHIRYHIPAMSPFVACGLQFDVKHSADCWRAPRVLRPLPSTCPVCLFLTHAVQPLIYEHLHSPTFAHSACLFVIYAFFRQLLQRVYLFTSSLVADVCISYAGATCLPSSICFAIFRHCCCSLVNPRKSSIAFSGYSTFTVISGH
jgi:hypothetical protein